MSKEKTAIQKTEATAITRAEDTRALTPGQMATVLLERDDFDVEKLGRLMELQEQYAANEARKAYVQALGMFRAQCPTIIRTRTVEFATKNKDNTHYTHAGLAETVEQIQGLLAACQLSSTWKIVRDEPTWIQVECRLSHHASGHTETTSLGGAPDMSGSKNSLQARASTVSYLERYTLKALLGLVDKDMPDDDGEGGAAAPPPPEPKSKAMVDPDVNAAKKRFAEAAAKKVGIDRCAPEFLRNVLKQTQTLTGSKEIGVCADWLSEHGSITDGVVYWITEDGQADATEDDGVTDGTEAGLPLGEDEGDNRKWRYTCDGCGMGYTVLPANGVCMSRDDYGHPNCPGKVGPT